MRDQGGSFRASAVHGRDKDARLCGARRSNSAIYGALPADERTDEAMSSTRRRNPANRSVGCLIVREKSFNELFTQAPVCRRHSISFSVCPLFDSETIRQMENTPIRNWSPSSCCRPFRRGQRRLGPLLPWHISRFLQRKRRLFHCRRRLHRATQSTDV